MGDGYKYAVLCCRDGHNGYVHFDDMYDERPDIKERTMILPKIHVPDIILVKDEEAAKELCYEIDAQFIKIELSGG